MTSATANENLNRICTNASDLFPDFRVRVSDLAKPTEAFLTKMLIHYLRAFGFRVEPTFNIDSEANDTSREKRLFLVKLCRQIERIMQISFPTRIFTYCDIIKPTSKKTANTLDVLFNYLCYFKMYKKDVYALVDERITQREALLVSTEAKRRELEELKKNATEINDNIANTEADILKVESEIQPAQDQLREEQKMAQQYNAELKELEKQAADVGAQMRHWQQLVVKDDDVSELQARLKNLATNIENCKRDLASKTQMLKERRVEIENNQAMCKDIDLALEQLTPHMLAEFKENLNLKEKIEKQCVSLEANKKQLVYNHEKQKKILEQSNKELKTLELQHKEEEQLVQQTIEKQKAAIEEKQKVVDNLEEHHDFLQTELQEQEQLRKYLEEYTNEIFADN